MAPSLSAVTSPPQWGDRPGDGQGGARADEHGPPRLVAEGRDDGCSPLDSGQGAFDGGWTLGQLAAHLVGSVRGEASEDSGAGHARRAHLAHTIRRTSMSRAHLGHPFTLPAVSPATMWRWNANAMRTGGIAAMTPPVASRPKSTP